MAQTEIRVPHESLKAFTREVFVRADLSPEDAAIEAEVLVWANLRGVDSHGVLRIPAYLENIQKGAMNPRPNVRVLKETPAILLVDADRAMGPVVTAAIMKKTITKAKAIGIGWALIRNVTHQGAMGYYALMAAQEGLAGIAIVCSPPNMAPFGAKAAGVHNSPIALAVPTSRHRPLILDMATSVAAGGKLTLAQDKGVPIPPTWALDRDGVPTTDPNLATILLPAGGPKGSGLALMFECLSSLMAGNPLLQPVLSGQERRHQQNSIVAAIDIGAFTDVETYRANADALIDAEKALPRAEGHSEVFVPGEPEDRTCEDRTRNGIPLPAGTVSRLRKVAEELGVKFPV